MRAEDADTEHAAGDYAKPLMIGAGVVAVLVLLLAFLTLVLVIDMRGDVADIADQSRKSLKATKAVEDALAEMRKTAPGARSAADAAANEAPAPAVPTHIDAADTAGDCIIRPGSGKGLADCIKPAPR